MNKWEMTFKQYCENWLENSRYCASYRADRQKWENKKQDLLPLWAAELMDRAKVGPIPSDVLMSYIRQYNEENLLHTFRGVYEKGIQDFRISLKVREMRTVNA